MTPKMTSRSRKSSQISKDNRTRTTLSHQSRGRRTTVQVGTITIQGGVGPSDRIFLDHFRTTARRRMVDGRHRFS